MTVIAGFVDREKVWIGGDSAGVSGWELTLRSDPKVFRKGDFLFGFTSSFRMGQLLRYKFKAPTDRESDAFCYMAAEFVDAVRDCLKGGGFASKSNEVESGGSFLVGYRSRLFQVHGDYQVAETLDGYDACGCGDSAAKGALFATQGLKLPPKKRMEIVLKAAEHHSAGVRAPFVIDSV